MNTPEPCSALPAVTVEPLRRSHLNALELRLSHERERLTGAATPRERAQRMVWIAACEREIADERKFLGLPALADLPPMTDDELLAALGV